MECELMDQCSDISSTSGIGGEVVIAMMGSEPEPQEKSVSLHKVIELALGKEDVKDTHNDEKLTTTTTSSAATRAPPALIAIKVKKEEKKAQYCEIPKCSAKVDKLTFASAGVLAYYGFKNKFAIVKVCSDCLKRAKTHEKNAVASIRRKESIFVWKHEPQPEVETIDLDDDTPGPDSSRRETANDEIEVDFDREDVAGIVHQVFKKYGIHKQIEESKKIVLMEADQLKKEYGGLNQMMESVDEMLHNTCHRYNHVFGRPPKVGQSRT